MAIKVKLIKTIVCVQHLRFFLKVIQRTTYHGPNSQPDTKTGRAHKWSNTCSYKAYQRTVPRHTTVLSMYHRHSKLIITNARLALTKLMPVEQEGGRLDVSFYIGSVPTLEPHNEREDLHRRIMHIYVCPRTLIE